MTESVAAGFGDVVRVSADWLRETRT